MGGQPSSAAERLRTHRSPSDRPPSVPVGELCDAIDACVRTGTEATASQALRARHPLQPFDRRNFSSGALLAAGLDPWWAAGCATLVHARAATAAAGGGRPISEKVRKSPNSVNFLEFTDFH